MQIIHCACGIRLSGHGPDEVAEALRVHVHEAHAQWGIPDQYLRDLRTASARMAPWDGQSVALEQPPEIHALTPERVGDFLRFFDRYAFMDNPLWSGCYCMYYHHPGSEEEWTRRPATMNREEKKALIRSGQAHGYLAYASGQPVAWCHAAPRGSLPGITRISEGHDDDAEAVGAIVCFVVAAPYRRQGVARRLLDAACAGFRNAGLAVAEAYPLRTAHGDARAFHGPLDMYLAAGFRPHRETVRFVVVRKDLR